MQIKCDYCGAYFSDVEEKCPTCGAPNNQLRRTASSIPLTIEELQQFVQEKNIPAEQIRFFIGVDYREPKAYGIYKDEMTGNFVVYKNKADGTRAVRYEGRDEAYAVNEIYQKLREEINDNNERNQTSASTNTKQPYQMNRTYAANQNDKEIQQNKKKFRILLVIVILVMALSLFLSITRGAGRNGNARPVGGGGYRVENSRGYDYDYDDDDSSYEDYQDAGSTYDDSWDTDWDASDSWDSDWSSFDSNWDSDW